eukprot:4184587-Amphidinium_carterae.1
MTKLSSLGVSSQQFGHSRTQLQLMLWHTVAMYRLIPFESIWVYLNPKWSNQKLATSLGSQPSLALRCSKKRTILLQCNHIKKRLNRNTFCESKRKAQSITIRKLSTLVK